jgi:ABC-type branched-subunit amino acid transport system substrate-binding protein
VVGVVGYGNTELTFALKNIYEENKMPLLVPTVSSDELIVDEKYIYQMASSINESSMLLTSVAYMDESMKNAVIIYSDDDYADEFSKTLELRLTENKRVAVVDKICRPDVYKDIPECLKKWKALDVDTVFLIGHDILLYQDYVSVINELDSNIRIYFSDDFENYYLDGREAYPYYENVYQCSMAQYDYNDEITDFYKRYKENFGFYPNSDAVQVYDSIMIIAKAIAENNVRTSEELKDFLDSSENINSIYGDEIYLQDNMMCGKMCFLQKYNEDGTLSYSFGMVNDDLYDVWYNYYPIEMINELARTGDYSDEQQ